MDTTFIGKLRAVGICTFRDESAKPLWNAQRNLSSRTHYVDDDTLRCFGARVLECKILENGLLLGIVESVSHPSKGRLFRPVFFDVFGTVVSRPEIDSAYKTAAAARNAFWSTADNLNAVELTKTGLVNRQENITRELAGIVVALAG